MKYIILTTIIASMILCNCNQTNKVDKLKAEVEAKFASVEGDFALAFKNLSDTSQFLLINANENFHAASTMKTPVMIEIFKQAQAKKFGLDDSLLVENQFTSIIDGSVYSMNITDDSGENLYEFIGGYKSVRQLVYDMITVSSNLATNILIQKVGAENVTETMRDLGAMQIEVKRGVEDTKAFEKGINNTVTAFDLMLIFEKLALPGTFDEVSRNEMIEILCAQKFNDLIPVKLPKGLRIAHKTGSITGVQHD